MMKHPLHPIVVHFPIACWSLSSVSDVLYLFTKNELYAGAEILILIGCISAVIAMCAGLIDLRNVPQDASNSMTKNINLHMLAAITTLALYSVSLIMRYSSSSKEPIEPSWMIYAFSLLGFISLSITGWLGGHLVYKHKIGVIKEQQAK